MCRFGGGNIEPRRREDPAERGCLENSRSRGRHAHRSPGERNRMTAWRGDDWLHYSKWCVLLCLEDLTFRAKHEIDSPSDVWTVCGYETQLLMASYNLENPG